MNGTSLTLGLVGLAALAGASRRGSRASGQELDALASAVRVFWKRRDPRLADKPLKLYHGTTGRNWSLRGGGVWDPRGGPLHLAADPADSIGSARAMARIDSKDAPDPRLYVLDLDEARSILLDGIGLDVDHGYNEDIQEFWDRTGSSGLSPRQVAMWESGRAWEVGVENLGFVVFTGDTERVKALMREVPRRLERDGGFSWSILSSGRRR